MPRDLRPLGSVDGLSVHEFLAERCLEDVVQDVQVAVHGRRCEALECLLDVLGNMTRLDPAEREGSEELTEARDLTTTRLNSRWAPVTAPLASLEPFLRVLIERETTGTAVSLPLDANESLAELGLSFPVRPAVSL